MHLGMTGEGIAPQSPMPSPESRQERLSTSPEGRGKRCAFSLVELSIVLVILGLLVGGVISGQSLIRASQLRSITTDYTSYVTATRSFRDKYFALPGDMPNATAFWGQETIANCTTANIIASTGTATCNGNGNGQVADGGWVNLESWRYWQQLANAGLINGTFSGTSAIANEATIIPRLNVPGTRIDPSAGWDIRAWGDQTAAGSAPSGARFFDGSFGNAFRLGTQSGGGQSGGANGAILKPEETWNIDTKMDDGKPGTGLVRTMEDNGVNCNNVAQDNAALIASTATYNLSNTAKSCTLVFANAF